LVEVVERDVQAIRLPWWGRVVRVDDVVPWLVVDPAGVPVDPIRRFLIAFLARGNRLGSVRSYAYDLLRWWRWLLCTCQASGCESVGSCWLGVTAFAAGPGASAKTCWWTTAATATLPAAVRENEEVVPVNVSTWVLPSGVTVGR
jgi:hypothetical protein